MLATTSSTVAPTEYRALARFCSGTKREKAEVEIDQIVAEYHAGQRDDAEFRTTEASGNLVGVAGIGLEVATLQHPLLVEPGDYAYVAFLGLSHDYRRGGEKNRLQGASSLGDVLLLDALSEIDRKWGSRIRGVLAQIGDQNRWGRDLAKRHGFHELFAAAGPEYDAWYRRLSTP